MEAFSRYSRYAMNRDLESRRAAQSLAGIDSEVKIDSVVSEIRVWPPMKTDERIRRFTD